jgi:transcriptional regulator with XRE-family HTH domain
MDQDDRGDREYIAARLREELKRQRYPHQAAADQLGIDRSAVSLKLRGERRFSAEELVILARWLNVPVANFLPATVEVA